MNKNFWLKITKTKKELLANDELMDWIRLKKPELLITMGAGNIDQWIEPIKQVLNET